MPDVCLGSIFSSLSSLGSMVGCALKPCPDAVVKSRRYLGTQTHDSHMHFHMHVFASLNTYCMLLYRCTFSTYEFAYWINHGCLKGFDPKIQDGICPGTPTFTVYVCVYSIYAYWMHPSPIMPVVWQSHDMNLTFPVLHRGDVCDLLFLMEVLGENWQCGQWLPPLDHGDVDIPKWRPDWLLGLALHQVVFHYFAAAGRRLHQPESDSDGAVTGHGIYSGRTR